MTLDPADLQRIAHLSGLRIEAEQLDQMVRDVQNILDFISIITGTETDTDPFRPGPATAPVRSDEPTPERCVTDLGEIAPLSRDGFVLTPRPPGVEPER